MATQYDPTAFGYQNFYSALLTADITSGSLTISLDSVPSPSAGILVIDPDSATNREVILFTSKGTSTVTCPSDGRGWAGTTATAHLTGTTVIMAPVAEFFKGLADGTLSTDPMRQEVFSNFVASGGTIAQSSGLIGTFSNIVFYLNGRRYSGTSIANKTYTASKDTYVDVTGSSDGSVTVAYNEVANGAAAPALTTNYIRVAKVVTGSSAITSVTQSGADSLGNSIKPAGAIGSRNIDFASFLRPAIGTINPTATGNLSVTGLGFKPRLVRFDLLTDRGLGANATDAVEGFGYASATTKFTKSTHNTTSNSYAYSSTSHCISGLHFNSTTPELLGDLVSFDDDGFTLNFSAASGGGGSGYIVGYTAY